MIQCPGEFFRGSMVSSHHVGRLLGITKFTVVANLITKNSDAFIQY